MYRSLLVTVSNMECVLEDGVHDPADAKGRLDDIGNDFFHCGRENGQKVHELEAVYLS